MKQTHRLDQQRQRSASSAARAPDPNVPCRSGKAAPAICIHFLLLSHRSITTRANVLRMPTKPKPRTNVCEEIRGEPDWNCVYTLNTRLKYVLWGIRRLCSIWISAPEMEAFQKNVFSSLSLCATKNSTNAERARCLNELTFPSKMLSWLRPCCHKQRVLSSHSAAPTLLSIYVLTEKEKSFCCFHLLFALCCQIADSRRESDERRWMSVIFMSEDHRLKVQAVQ